MDLSKGADVGGYIIEDLVGSGGMANVYRVRHRALGSVHALKVLRRDLVMQDGVRARFLDEGRVQARLRHPGLVRVTDLVSQPGVAGLVMDLLHGEDLAHRLERGPLPEATAAGWMIQALDAVTYAHNEGVVHRDLKPANLFLERAAPSMRVRVLDFGIAKVRGRDRRTRGALGTYAYMAPEQIEAPGTVDNRADVFALGAVLHEMLTGHPAFEDDTDYATMQRILTGRAHALSESFDGELVSVIHKAVSLDRDDRFATCDAFADALRAHADPAATSAPRAQPTPIPLDLPPRVALPSPHDPVVAPTIAEAALPAPRPPVTAPPAPVPPTRPSPPVVAPPAPVPEALVDRIPTVVDPPHNPIDEPDVHLKPLVKRRVSKKKKAQALEPMRRKMGRASAVLQLLSGSVNVALMWVLPCAIIGPVTTDLSLSPDPAQNVWGACLACGIASIGVVELVVGLWTLGSGGRRWRMARNLAWLQLLGVLSGGLVSGLVGIVVLLLFASVPSKNR